jgi:hypothetical protein
MWTMITLQGDPMMKLSLYQTEYPLAPVLLLDMGSHGLRVCGPKGVTHYVRDVDPSEIPARLKPVIQASVARAIREGAAREEGERILDGLFRATCLRESWAQGAQRGLR